MSEVKNYKETESIETYKIKDPDINPYITEYQGNIYYPYPLKDDISDDSEEVEYELYCLENEYFKISVLPSMGGKLYSAYDKRSNEHIFYRNPVIKPQLVGATGAWTAGGVEFNFPNRGHRPSATDYTDTVFKNYEDSAAIIISEIGKIAWMRFSVELRLYTGKAYIEQTVRMYNDNDYEDSYYFWSTSAEREKEGLEFRFPFLWHIEEESRKKYLWPLPEDGPFAAEGVDLRFSDTMKPFTLPFGSEVLKDYMGLYYPDNDSGIVHVADFRQVPGKKVWSWGKSSAGNRWNKRLTGNDEKYVELQSGAVETQNEFNIIEPHNKIEYKEYWLHSNNNGPLCSASKDVIASYNMNDSAIEFSFSATDFYEDVEFKLFVGNEEVSAKTLQLSPIENNSFEVPFSTEWMDRTIGFEVRQGSNVLLSETMLDNDKAKNMIDEKPYISKDETRSSRIAQGEQFEKRRKFNKAIDLYNEVLEDNPDCVPVYINKANCYLKKRRYEKALEVSEKAIKANPEDVDSIYTYALSLWNNHKRYEAVKYFDKVPNSSKLFPAASYFIAVYYVTQDNYKKALEMMEYNIKHFSYHYKSFQLKVYILNQMGKIREAKTAIERYLEGNPQDYLAVYLQSEILEEEISLHNIFSKKQNVYTILSFFDELKEWGKCVDVISKFEEVHSDPSSLMVGYKHYYLNKLKSSDKERKEMLNCLNNLSLDYVFPNHRIDEKILKTFQEESDNAKYLYGLIQYRKRNIDLAMRTWEELAEDDFHYSILYRNLAHLYQKHENNYEKSEELAKRGLNKEPPNDRLFYILYKGYKKLDSEDKIRELLISIEDFEGKSEPCRRTWIDILNYLGDHEKAVEILENTKFNLYEHGMENLVPYSKLYKESYLGLAKNALKNDNYNLALEHINKCLNMEKRYEQSFAEIYFYAGITYEKLGEFEQALKYYNKIIAQNIKKEDRQNYQYYVKAANRVVKLNWIGITK